MKRIIQISFLLFILVNISAASPADTLVYGAFGKVVIYQPKAKPESFVIFISGDGGWNSGVVNMADQVVKRGAFVVGIDIRYYLKNIKSSKAKCYYMAGDFEELSLTIQKKYKMNQYFKPILMGFSSGATLAYGMLAQAPANTFKGAIVLGFCPDIEIDKPMCKGSGLNYHVLKPGRSFYLEAFEHMSAPFIVLNGTIDQICNYNDTKNFMDKIPLSELVTLPNVGHGFSVTKNWVPQFILAYQKVLKEPGYVEKLSSQNQLLQSQKTSLLKTDLPLCLLPATKECKLPLALFISGDGGWTSFDNSVCTKLAENGIPVVGLDAQKYFWNERKPKESADDLSIAIQHYMQLWKKDSFLLLGYSFGACVLPYIANDLSDQMKENIKAVYCLSPDVSGDFEIHIADMLDFSTKEKYSVPLELKQIKSLNPICIFGSEEDSELKQKFVSAGIQVETIPGSHHYNNDFQAIAAIVIKNIENTK